jgi:hypothetical protein
VYGTSEKFMDYFGIKSLQDLPKPKDFKEVDNQIGEASSLDEVVETITEPIGEETSGNIPSNVPSNVQDN